MSDLQIVLIVIGVLIIAGVIVFNWWQERRFHQQLENGFSSLKMDALLDDPKLDVTSLYGKIDDDRADSNAADQTHLDQTHLDQTHLDQTHLDQNSVAQSISFTGSLVTENQTPIQEHTLTYAENSAEELFIQPSDDVPEMTADPELGLDNDTKNKSQHADIKSIFNEVFSHSGTEKLQAARTANVEGQAEIVHNNIDQAAPALVDDIPTLTLPAMLHPQIDLTAILYLANETPVSALSNEFMALLSGYDKPVFVHVLDTDKQWYSLKDMQLMALDLNQKIAKIACSLQLADRAGAVSRGTLNRFQLAVETLGLDIGAHVEWQGAGDALVAATALDTFCIEVDKTIGFHLVHGESGAFTGTKLRGLAEAQGLTISPDGTFKYFDQDSASGSPQLTPSFVMFNREDYPFSVEMLRSSVIKGVTFQMDIPHVNHCAEAYNKMVQVAKQMAVALNATLVAENNKELNDLQIEKIRQQLNVIHATMLARGIAPASDCALRLFS